MSELLETFQGQLWWADRTRPNSVPAIFKVEVQPPLLPDSGWVFICYYWWHERSHRVSVPVTDTATWKTVAADHLHHHFTQHYPDDAAALEIKDLPW